MGNVIISPNIRKESVRINPAGDVINPRTKEIIQPVTPAYIPTPQELKASTQGAVEVPQASTTNTTSQVSALSILDQINEAKNNLKALEELKQLKIAEKKAELELLQK